jgi:hypothetical protein
MGLGMLVKMAKDISEGKKVEMPYKKKKPKKERIFEPKVK